MALGCCYPDLVIRVYSLLIKPGVCPQPAYSWLWAHAWFPEILLRKFVCVCMYVRKHFFCGAHTLSMLNIKQHTCNEDIKH